MSHEGMAAAAAAPLCVAVLYAYATFEHICRDELTNHRRRLSWLALSVIVTLSFASADASITALGMALMLIILIGTMSRVKRAFCMQNLMAGDFMLLAEGGAIHIARRRPIAFAAAAALILSAGAAWVAIARFAPALHVSLPARLAVFATACLAMRVAVARGIRKGTLWPAFVFDDCCHVSTFIVTLFADIGPARAFRMQQVAETAAELPAAATAGRDRRIPPHLVFIQHESTFDPQVYGLKLAPGLEEFLRPPGALCGTLHVDIFGGLSWQSEFALVSGISSLMFGLDAPFIFKRGRRIRRSLPSLLRERGFGTTVMHTVPRGFCNYDIFYESLGVDIIAGGDLDRELVATESDRLFYDAALARLASTAPAGPQMLLLLTQFNHQPYRPGALTQHMREEVRQFALDDFASPPYAEYLTRMDFCARAYAEFRNALAKRFPGHPIVVVRYGDHQPHFVSPDLASRVADPAKVRHRTFYAIEGINCDLDPAATAPCDPLDLAFLGTLAMRAAGMTLDPVMTLHERLMAECGSDYFGTPSQAKERYHRLLLDTGAIVADAAT